MRFFRRRGLINGGLILCGLILCGLITSASYFCGPIGPHGPMGLWAYGVVVRMFDFHRSDRSSDPGRGGEKFHNVYDYTIERHPWQVSENHKPRVHPSHAREIG